MHNPHVDAAQAITRTGKADHSKMRYSVSFKLGEELGE